MWFKELKQGTPLDCMPYYEIDFCNHNTHKILKVDCRGWWLAQDRIVSWVEDNWDNIKEQTNEK